ncbi:hypothetical protein [Streptomyces sp. NPDC051561]|uniref:hypothetical protein n=1 Tax=Streptomyces sp. NPDC051561 TaxID=3365658 RepID=UPI0037AB9921
MTPLPPTGPVPALADTVADAACALADAVTTSWPADRGGALDAPYGLDALLGALAHLDADAARLLAPAVLAAARLRQYLDPRTTEQDHVQEAATPGAREAAPVVPGPRTGPARSGSRPRRRGRGPGYQGVPR